jgi:hypothetical protein
MFTLEEVIDHYRGTILPMYPILTLERIEEELEKVYTSKNRDISKHIIVENHSETQYFVRSKSFYGVVPKSVWDEAIIKAASIT